MEQAGKNLDDDRLHPNEPEVLPKSELELRDAAPGRARVDSIQQKSATQRANHHDHKGPAEKHAQGVPGKRDKSGNVDPVNPQLERDCCQPTRQPVDDRENNESTRFRKTLEILTNRQHSFQALKPGITVWHAFSRTVIMTASVKPIRAVTDRAESSGTHRNATAALSTGLWL